MRKRNRYVLKHMAISLAVILVLLLFDWISGLIWVEEKGVDILPADEIVNMKKLPEERTCLIIMDSTDVISELLYPLYEQILTDMRVGYDIFDISDASFTRFEFTQRIENYKTLVITINDYWPLEQEVVSLADWVKRGGRALLGIAPTRTEALDRLSPKLGIEEAGEEFVPVDDFVSADYYMLGNQKTYLITGGYNSALDATLDSESIVYAHTSAGTPIVWTRDYGTGRFVVCNFSYIDKVYRGIYASAYTLLEDVFVYPVINASTFYLDDFPSPTPSGDGEYIRRDYGMDVASFYKQVWWPKVLELGKKHNIPYTGLVIETYEDNTNENLTRNRSTSDHSYFGKRLINNGGELGFHGYNHQPLCGPDYVYEDDIGYNVWESYKAMYNALDELKDFSEKLFPTTDFSVYVPPSDILSKEGRELIGNDFKNIRCIASIYAEGPDAYSQEYEVAEDGVIETPRIVASCIIDDYMKLTAFGELNYHFVNSHFMHPDDLLDEERGAAIGWEQLSKNLDEYMTWVDDSAPIIRHLNGSGMAGAVQRYVNITPEVTVEFDQIQVKTEGLIDKAYYLVRSTEDELVDAKGGKLTQLNDTLYLLEVSKDIVTITRK